MTSYQHIAIIRDHSGSMSHLERAAMEDYNSNLNAIKAGSQGSGIKTYLTTIKCGSYYDAYNSIETKSTDINFVPPLTAYNADGGGTPLFDSIGRAIEILQESAYNMLESDAEHSFLVLAVTDGENNVLIRWTSNRLKDKFAELEKSGNWTFAFRVPQGRYKANLVRQFNIPEDNVLEWETTTRGVEMAAAATNQAMQTYYASRKMGARSSSAFFTNLKGVTTEHVKKTMTDISAQLRTYSVLDGIEGSRIDNFIVKKTGSPYTKGTAFYELVKSEKVQDTKGVIIRNKHTRSCYSGLEARNLLGLPMTGEVRIRPGQNGEWDIFIQSRSDNRILPVGSEVLFWANAPR